MRSAFEMLPQAGDVISIADKSSVMRVLDRLAQVLDVDRASIDDGLRAYLRATGPEDTRASVVAMVRRAKALHPEYTNEMLRMWRNNTESLFWTADHDGTDLWKTTKHFAGDDMPFSVPHLSSELVREIPLPDWRAARDLRKLSTKAQMELKSPHPVVIHPDSILAKGAAKFGVPYRRLAQVFRPFEVADRMAGTVVGEGWAKLARAQDFAMSRLWTPAILLRGGWMGRVVGEEQFRMAAVGLSSGVRHPTEWLDAMKAKGAFERFAEVPEELQVSYLRDQLQRAPTAMRVRKGTSGYLRAWAGELRQLAGAQEMRMYLQYVANEGATSGAAERMVNWLDKNPAGRELWEQMRVPATEVLRPAGIATTDKRQLIREWVDTFPLRLQDKTRGNQALVTLVRDGKLSLPLEDLLSVRFGGELPARMQDLLEEDQGYLRTGTPVPHEVQLELEGILGAGLTADKAGVLRAHVPLSDGDAVESFLKAFPDEQRPNFVKGRGFNTEQLDKPTQWVSAMFDVLGAKPTKIFSRSPAYRQFAAREYARLRGLGVSEARATERASTYGVQQVKDLLYELGEKSALHDQLRHISPFLNAWQEVFSRWVFGIPLRSGVYGYPALVRKVQLAKDAAEQSGLIYQNKQGEWVTKIPGFDHLVSSVMGVPMRTEFGLRGFNMVGQPPGLSPISLAALENMPGIKEQWDKPGPLKAVFDMLTPYGPEVNLGPAWLGRAWWAVSKGRGPNNGAPPLEVFSSRYQRQLWVGTVIDAMRVIDAKQKKDTGTGILEQIATMPEGSEKDHAYAEFLQQAETMGRHFFTVRAVTGALLPAQPSYYWPNNDEAQAFYEALNKIPQGSPARQQLYDQFIGEHPNLVPYLVGKSVADPEVKRPTDAKGGFSIEEYWRQVRDGARTRLSPDQWERYAAGSVDYQMIQHDYRVQVAQTGDTAAERLRNYSAVMDASNRRAAALERLSQTNPLWKAQWDIQLGESQAAKGIAAQTYQQQVAANFARDVKVVTDLVNDTPLAEQIDLGALRTARRALLDAYGSGYSTVADQGGVDGDVARYFRDVMDPYFNQIDALYAKAALVPKDQRAPLYEQVRELRNTFTAPAGEGLPAPEEVLYGMADQEQRVNLQLKRAGQPPGWLSGFQLQTVGLPVDEQHREFWDTVNKSEAAVREYFRQQHWIPTEKRAQDELANFQAWKEQFAKANGLDDEIAREQFTPFDRAASAHALVEPEWNVVGQAVSAVNGALAAASTDPAGTPASIDSRAGRPIFDDFAAWLDAQRLRSSTLDQVFTRWGKILGGDQPLVGTDLYRVFLFGEFR